MKYDCPLKEQNEQASKRNLGTITTENKNFI